MGPYHPQVALAPRTRAIQQSASGVGTTVFVHNVSELQMYGRISDPGMGPDLPRVALAPRTSNPTQSAMSQWVWGFHTVRSGIDQRDRRFRPRFVGVVRLWKDS